MRNGEGGLQDRTKALALAVIDLAEHLPRGVTADVIRRQLIRAGTSVGANYRAACHCRSRREFIAKLGIVEEEADETMFWLEVIVERGLILSDRCRSLREEAREIVAMTVSSIRTARRPRTTISHFALRTSH
jgi:four helix bundle protein